MYHLTKEEQEALHRAQLESVKLIRKGKLVERKENDKRDVRQIKERTD